LKLKQPKGFYLISLGELCERFSYYGAQTLLVLYLTTKFSLTDSKSYSLYGAYAAFSYALPLLGGFLADRFLGLKQTLIIGGLLLVVGNLLMSFPYLNTFYAGLSLTACGIGLYKPNSSSMVGKLYADHDKRRDSGFTLFYIGMNIGATISPFIYGLSRNWGYHYGYLFSAAILFINWLIFLIHKRHIFLSNLDEDKKQLKTLSQKLLIYCSVLAVCILINILFLYPALLSNFLLFSGAIVLSALIFYAVKCEPLERNKMFALLILGLFGMCFFAASLQTGSSINLFIERNINRDVLGYQVPAIMFTSLYPLAVILIAPVMVVIWSYLSNRQKEPTAPAKFGFGLILVSLGFISFMLATMSSGKDTASHIPIFWIVMGNLALGAGEVCLMPIMFSTIALFAPNNLKSTMMGVWYLFIAFGGYLSGFVAKLSSQAGNENTNKILSDAVYQHAFLKISITSFLIACAVFILKPWIKSLMGFSSMAGPYKKVTDE
jgi:POT family proton-dependent oligopeptide transporter